MLDKLMQTYGFHTHMKKNMLFYVVIPNIWPSPSLYCRVPNKRGEDVFFFLNFLPPPVAYLHPPPLINFQKYFDRDRDRDREMRYHTTNNFSLVIILTFFVIINLQIENAGDFLPFAIKTCGHTGLTVILVLESFIH